MYEQIGRLDLLNDTRHLCMCLKPCENGRNIVGFYLLRPFARPFACFCVFLGVAAQSLKPKITYPRANERNIRPFALRGHVTSFI